MEKLYIFQATSQRNEFLSGLFIANEANVQEAIGKCLFFGKILGKHNNICIILRETDIKLITDDQEFIAKAKIYGLHRIGYNPLNYLLSE